MERDKKDRRVFIPLEKYPQFGTTYKDNKANFFCPFYPNEANKIIDTYMQIDPNYKYKETFYIYIDYQEDNKKGIFLSNF